MTIQKNLQLSDMFSWIFSEIPKNMPDTKIIRRVQISCTIVRLFFWIVMHLFWDCQAPLGLSSTFSGIVKHFFWDIMLISSLQKGAKTG